MKSSANPDSNITFRFLSLLLLFCPVFAQAAAPSAADFSRSIREAGLDPEECYRVRDLTLHKDDVRVYFTDGYLIFSKPVAGERLSAVFTTDVEGGDGEVLLLPPYRGERQSLAAFTQSPNLDEHFRAVAMIFTDGASRALLDQIAKQNAGKKVPEMGTLLAEKWSPVVANIADGFRLSLVQDLFAPSREGSGLVFLAFNGKQLGNFDIMYDARLREQVLAGQLVERDGRLTYNIWTSFAARSARTGAIRLREMDFSLARFRIDAALDADLHMKAVTRVAVHVGANPVRVFPFEAARAIRVTAARIDGRPAELFFQESVRGRALRRSDNDVFLVVAPEALAAESEHEFEFEHEGSVIATAGQGVYYVAARHNWYPRSGAGFATYDLTFRYPKRLTLVTAGDVVEDRVEGDLRITERRTPVPIRIAGFNLGEYEKVSGSAPGFTVEVYGNRHLETALQPKVRDPLSLPPMNPMPRSRREVPAIAPALPPPDPLARLRSVAADVSSALEFFSSRFGPPGLKTLTVAPIPAAFGQGFPGLVYLSTLTYLDPTESPAALRDRRVQLFFSDLIEAHEVAHQWWGNVVTSAGYQDEWLLEALASYSALLWLERQKGARAAESVLEDYRDHLLVKNTEGRTLESVGPIIWGGRLATVGTPDAWRAITYEKGAWILHMLRRRLGNERFLKMLAELRHRYEFRPVSSEDFRALAKEFLPPRTKPAVIDTFFDNWVYSTGVPALKVRFTTKGAPPEVKISGTVAQTGVEDDFSAEVPVEIQFAKGAPQTIWVQTASDPAPFSATLKQAPLRVMVPAAGVLAAKR